jgi:hypothetical protein
VRGRGHRCEWRRVSEEEAHQALSTYARDYPVYGRAILRTLRQIHGLSGEPVEAVARAVPVLGLRE